MSFDRARWDWILSLTMLKVCNICLCWTHMVHFLVARPISDGCTVMIRWNIFIAQFAADIERHLRHGLYVVWSQTSRLNFVIHDVDNVKSLSIKKTYGSLSGYWIHVWWMHSRDSSKYVECAYMWWLGKMCEACAYEVWSPTSGRNIVLERQFAIHKYVT